MRPITVRNLILEWGARTYVMGILNITPDSFSGDGLMHSSLEAGRVPVRVEGMGVRVALDQARRFIAAGSHILDIGGESTRPGSQPVSADEEMGRVIPVIEAIRKESDVVISIDTYKATVAEAALNAGADIINDIWGFRVDPQIATVAARHGVPVILMHNRSNPANVEIRERLGNSYVGSQYENLIEDVKRELLESVSIARAAGVKDEKIILDPGIGFGKTVPQNIELINRLDEIRALGFPVLLGTSRKSFIGVTLDLPPDQRVEGTAATLAVGIVRGADIIRVHDVEMMTRIARMTDAIVRH
jgi:dihydropteroate synthase